MAAAAIHSRKIDASPLHRWPSFSNNLATPPLLGKDRQLWWLGLGWWLLLPHWRLLGGAPHPKLLWVFSAGGLIELMAGLAFTQICQENSCFLAENCFHYHRGSRISTKQNPKFSCSNPIVLDGKIHSLPNTHFPSEQW